MSASTSRNAPFYLRRPPRDVRVLNWPLRHDPWRAGPMLLAGMTAAVGVGIVSDSVLTSVLAVAAVAVSLWRTWTPVVYEFDPRGVTQIVLRRRRVVPWLTIADYEFTPRGVLLFPHGDPTWWNASQALFVLWADKRNEIAEVVEYFIGGRLMLEESSRSQPSAAITVSMEQEPQAADPGSVSRPSRP